MPDTFVHLALEDERNLTAKLRRDIAILQAGLQKIYTEVMTAPDLIDARSSVAWRVSELKMRVPPAEIPFG